MKEKSKKSNRKETQYSPLAPRSRAKAICSGKIPEPIARSIDVGDMPYAASQLNQRLMKKADFLGSKYGASKRKAAIEIYTLMTFLRLECYFGVEGNNRVLDHMLRLKDGAHIKIDQIGKTKDSAIRFSLALDSLVQLARIPDILTSSTALSVFTVNEFLLARVCESSGYESNPLSDYQSRLIEESRKFRERFDYVQRRARETHRIRNLHGLYDQWICMLKPLLADTNFWRVGANRASFNRLFPEGSFVVKKSPQSHHSFNKLKSWVLKHYAEKLQLKTLDLL